MTHDKTQIIEELQALKSVITANNSREQSFTKFCPVFPFTTENIKAYLNLFDLNGANLLVPCASGDHALEALNKGAEIVDMFDINSYAYHMARLKFAAVKSLSKEDFLTFFAYRNDETSINHNTWDRKLYEKIRINLPQYSRNFWDQTFNILSSLTKKVLLLTDLNLLIKSFRNKQELVLLLDYLKEDNYEILKEKIIKMDEDNIEYFNCNVTELANKAQEKKYDLILLSNIQDYIKETYQTPYGNTALNRYREYVDRDLSKLIKDNGSIISEYYYYYGVLSYITPTFKQEVITFLCFFDE